jgi:exodeoxyribonuclease VIII
MGRAVHLAVLEPSRFKSSIATYLGGARRGKDWDAFKEYHAGKELLLPDEHGECLSIAAAVGSNSAAMKHLAFGHGEVTVLWDHQLLPGHSIQCKARLDWLGPDSIVDLKTTRDASPDGFAREVHKYGYHVQASYYQDGHAAASGRRLPYFIVAVESEAPYAVTVFRVPESLLSIGRAAYTGYLTKLALARAEDSWPSYADGEVELTLPKWATVQAESIGADNE